MSDNPSGASPAATETTRHGVDPRSTGHGYEPSCLCGRSMHWVDCWDCGGEGYHDDYENDPLWYSGPDDPEAMEVCLNCEGKGGYWICDSVPGED